MSSRALLIGLAGIIFLNSVLQGQQEGGTFHGRVVVEWLEDASGPDRDMKVLEEFSFQDAAGREWRVPAGVVVNGASIPRAFWTAVGPPFVGDYRRASVVHDHYCETKESTWKATHRMFYDGVIAGGIPRVKAKVMYAAVYGGGPRWTPIAGAEPGSPQFLTVSPDFTEEDLQQIEAWIEAEDPSLRELERRVELTVQE